MRIRYLVKKEFIEIFRQKELLPMIFIAPMIMITILGYVVKTDVENLSIDIINLSQNKAAVRIINRLQQSPLFNVRHIYYENRDNVDTLKRGNIKAVIIFRDALEKPLSKDTPSRYPEIQVLLDGVDSNTSGIAAGYFNGILKNYILTDISRWGVRLPVETKTLIRYNPQLRSINYMGPGIVALMLTIIALFFTSLSIVREKEQQTMDTLLISRLTPIEIYIGKALPMAIIGLIHMTIGILVVIFWFQIPVRGNLLYLLLAAPIFLAAILSYALLISTLVSTQQQALFFAWFSMILFILLSGLFTPTENVPGGLRFLVKINPLAYLIKIIREIFLKGNGIEYFYKELLSLAGITTVILTISLLNFKRIVSR
ncbi:MAG: ABC transporter permease [Candidatus Aminicenantes bacterium]|nr:ABC transporter permease [Candidatus Aminicenantes bacterium]